MLMLDLFAGLGGASTAMRDRGWDVVTVDNEASFNCTVTTDLASWSWDGERPDLVWASPPCQEFSRWGMPWLRAKNPPAPSLDLVKAAMRVIRECEPNFWVIENVRGAVQWLKPLLGPVKCRWGSAFLWGKFPAIGRPRVKPHKERLSSKRRAERSKIPLAISLRLAMACESTLVI